LNHEDTKKGHEEIYDSIVFFVFFALLRDLRVDVF